MQIVINIPDGCYEELCNANFPIQDAYRLVEWIKNGIVLPEGHGNLKDELDLNLFAPSLGTDEYIDELMARHNIDYINDDDEDKVRAFALNLIDSCMNVIETAPTIIEVESEN